MPSKISIYSNLILRFSYSSTFIEKEFRKYFHEYLLSTSLLPYITDEQQFSLLRNKLFHPSTDQQSKTTQNVSNTDIQNDSIPRIPKKQENKLQNKLFIHQTHEKRFRSMPRGLHELHKELFSQSATKTVKMIVGGRNRRNATHELIRKWPLQSLLKNQQR